MPSTTTLTRLALTVVFAAGLVSAQTKVDKVSTLKSNPRPVAMTQAPSSVSPAPAAPVAPLIALQTVCHNKDVTVKALNASLARVLKAVADCAGADVQVPIGLGSTPVSISYGPIPVRDMFTLLLDGSADYVIFGSQQDPSAVQTVIVKPHQTLGATGGRQVAHAAAPAQPQNAAPATFTDDKGVERLMSGLTPEEALLTPQELAAKFEAEREAQKRRDDIDFPLDPQ